MLSETESTDAVRRQVIDAFAQLGWTSAAEPRETILLRDLNYCGRRFEAEQGYAVWLIDEDRLEYFDNAGSIVRPPQSRTTTPLRRAA